MCSRVYLAAHSINQVLFGATIGCEIAAFFHYSVKPRLYEHLIQLSQSAPRTTEYKPLVRNSTIVFILSQALPLLVYWYLAAYTKVP